MSLFISIFIGGGIGALTRYVLIEQINKSFVSSFPYGTLTVNVIGAFLIGLAWSYFAAKINISDNLKMFITIGFLGGFTTFSSFNVDIFELIQNGSILISILVTLLINNLKYFDGILLFLTWADTLTVK